MGLPESLRESNAGYRTSADIYSAAAGTFSVPYAQCTSGATTYSLVWVGIDGDVFLDGGARRCRD